MKDTGDLSFGGYVFSGVENPIQFMKFRNDRDGLNEVFASMCSRYTFKESECVDLIKLLDGNARSEGEGDNKLPVCEIMCCVSEMADSVFDDEDVQRVILIFWL